MEENIGIDAGTVWSYLNERGETPVGSLVKATGLKKKQVERALGWLAREDKIRIENVSNKEMVSLVGVMR